MAWEYRVVPIYDVFRHPAGSVAPDEAVPQPEVTMRVGVLNDLGRDGWELVAVDGGFGFFKREVRGA